MKKNEFFCERQNFGRYIAVFMRQESSEDETVLVGSNIVFTKVSDASMVEPTFRITPHEAQSLMDELWSCGLRPTEGTGSAGAMAATERHLNDMRALSTKLLDKVVGP